MIRVFMIRGNTIRNISFKKKQEELETTLEQETRILKNEVNTSFLHMSEEALTI